MRIVQIDQFMIFLIYRKSGSLFKYCTQTRLDMLAELVGEMELVCFLKYN